MPETGFTLGEIRRLLLGFRDDIAASERRRRRPDRKLEGLDRLARRIDSTQQLLRRLQTRFRCATLDERGKAMATASPQRTR